MRPSLVAHAPTRLDFGGGWTDVPPYAEERGGFVCNLAIERRATVRIDARDSHGLHENENLPLVIAACTAAGVRDAQVTVTSDFPFGAGLGGSSAAGVALAAALARWNHQRPTLHELAQWSRSVETGGLQMAGGFQDHYAAAFGGALALTFNEGVQVRPIPLATQTASALESRCLLLYTGESRISGETITAVLDAYKARDEHVVHALERMKQLAMSMATALQVGDINELGALVLEHWSHQRALHPRITTERIDAIAERALGAGALGLKALGASGGGCVIIVSPEEGVERVARAVDGLGERLDWRIAHTGVQVTEVLPLSLNRVSG